MAVIPTKNEFARTPGGVTIPTSGEFVKVPDGGGGGVTVTPLSITENGTYTAPSGTAYSPVTVDVAASMPYFEEVQEYIQVEDWLTDTLGNTKHFADTYMNASETDYRFRIAYVTNNHAGKYCASVFWVCSKDSTHVSGGGSFSNLSPNRDYSNENSFYLTAGSKITVIYLNSVKRDSSEA